MPDPNKHAVLAAQGFKIAKTCSTCVHWGASSGAWGRCALAGYQHRKHTERMTAGTPDIGTCDKHSLDGRSVESAVGPDYVRYTEDDPGILSFYGKGFAAGVESAKKAAEEEA